jgi:hypothetical protein
MFGVEKIKIQNCMWIHRSFLIVAGKLIHPGYSLHLPISFNGGMRRAYVGLGILESSSEENDSYVAINTEKGPRMESYF